MLKDLRPDIRIMVIKWMRDSLTANLSKSIGAMTYQKFAESILKKSKFSAEAIWSSLLPKQREHLEHCLPFLDALEAEMIDAARELTPEPEPQPEPENGVNDEREI